MGEWINKLWYTHMMKHYSVIKRNEVWNHKNTLMNLKCMFLIEKKPTSKSSILYNSNYMTFWKRENSGDDKISVWSSGWGVDKVKCRRFFRLKNLFSRILKWWIGNIKYFFKLIELCNTKELILMCTNFKNIFCEVWGSQGETQNVTKKSKYITNVQNNFTPAGGVITC